MKSIKGKLHYNGPGKLEDRDGKGSCTLYVNYRKKNGKAQTHGY